ncbi:MAG: DUF4358 domain-containing protein [Hungatella sp.]
MRKILITAALMAAAMMMMTGCKSQPSKDTAATQETTVVKTVNLEDIHMAVKAAYGENYIPNFAYEEQMMEDLFGLKKDLYDSYIGEGPMISVHVDNFVAVKAKEGKGEEVQKVLEQYRESLVTDAMQYPVNLPKIQSSEIVRYGDYVFFVMLGTPTPEAEAKGEKAALESAKENNQIAMKAIAGFFQ